MILYCTKDMIFATKIRSTAESLNFIVRPARDAQAIKNRLQQIDDGRGNDPVTGVIIDLDMNEDAISLLDQVKAHNKNIPVTAFGPHVNKDIFNIALEHAADFVMPRSQFDASLQAIFERLSETHA